MNGEDNSNLPNEKRQILPKGVPAEITLRDLVHYALDSANTEYLDSRLMVAVAGPDDGEELEYDDGESGLVGINPFISYDEDADAVVIRTNEA